ncbi:MAG: hypothetical protein LBQ66_01410 [Planctomycetaceae bacterium]|nr:hypothetical protein [Planctomycetaceae bacterium]
MYYHSTNPRPSQGTWIETPDARLEVVKVDKIVNGGGGGGDTQLAILQLQNHKLLSGTNITYLKKIGLTSSNFFSRHLNVKMTAATNTNTTIDFDSAINRTRRTVAALSCRLTGDLKFELWSIYLNEQPP